LVTTGRPYVYFVAVPVTLLPAGVLTITSTMLPVVPGGDTARICVGDITVKLFAATLPNMTKVTPVNPVPVIVTKCCRRGTAIRFQLGDGRRAVAVLGGQGVATLVPTGVVTVTSTEVPA